MGDTDEQLVELLKMLRPIASTPQGLETITGIFAKDKVAQEATRMLATLGLMDKDALANGLAKMVPTAPPKEPNGPPMVHVLPMGIPPPPPPLSFTAVPPPLPLQSQPIPGFQSQPPPLQQMRNDPRAQPPYGIASGMDTGWNAPPPPVQMQLPPPVAQPPPPQAIPALVQGLSEADRNMVLAALSMSPAQIDALPPQKRAIIMQLRSMVPGR